MPSDESHQASRARTSSDPSTAGSRLAPAEPTLRERSKSMVEDSRHAAGHTTDEVHEVLDDDPAVALGLRFSSSDSSGAIEFALDYLQPDGSSRREVSPLQIFKVESGG